MASGLGSTLAAALEYQKIHRPLWQIVGVISNVETSPALKIAEQYGVSRRIVSQKDFSNSVEWDLALLSALGDYSPDLIFLMGFLKKIGPETLQYYRHHIVNSHPSLLPKYGGRGLYGRKVHEAIWRNKDLLSGVSIHRLSAEFDEGQVLVQKPFRIEKGDTVEKIEQTAKDLEKKLVIEFLNALSAK